MNIYWRIEWTRQRYCSVSVKCENLLKDFLLHKSSILFFKTHCRKNHRVSLRIRWQNLHMWIYDLLRNIWDTFQKCNLKCGRFARCLVIFCRRLLLYCRYKFMFLPISGTGFKMSPITGQILASMALNQNTKYDISLFKISRFENVLKVKASL